MLPRCRQRTPAGGTQDRKRETRADDLRRRMRADILSGALRPGERLQFPEICRRYGTSVGVLREALTWLGAQGLVRTQAHQGTSSRRCRAPTSTS